MSSPWSDSGESEITLTPDPPRILAVVDKVRDGHGYIIRALHNGQITYIRAPEKAFAPGWDHTSGHEPDLSIIPPIERKAWRLAITSEARDGTAETLAAHTDGVPEKLSDGVSGLDHISDLPHIIVAEYLEFTNVFNFPSCCGRRSDRIQLVTHPKVGVSVVMKIAEVPDRLPVDEDDTTIIGTAEKEMCNEITYHQEVSRHSFVPKFVGLVTEQGRGIIGYLMEYIDGAKTYEEIKKEGKVLPDAEIEDCLAAARAVHKCGVYHGDLDLGNLLRCPDGSIRIIDFQLAKRLGEDGLVNGCPIYSAEWELNALEEELRGIGRPIRSRFDDDAATNHNPYEDFHEYETGKEDEDEQEE